MTITLRIPKGSPLTHGELDGNFEDLDGRFPVSYANIQDVSAASKLLGRGDDAAGDVQEITLGAGLTMTGTTLAAAGAGLPTDDTNPLVQDPVDTTKRGRIDVGAVATATTRAIIMGDRDVDLGAAGTFAENAHTHAAADIASGTLADARIAQSNVTQHQAALSIATSQITGDLPLVQIEDIAALTVLGNVGEEAAAPSPIAPETFKTEFGFGGLADKNNIVVSDISAGGTPGASTFLRGDGQWAGVIASVSTQVVDIDDATTLTLSHAKYSIVSGQLRITKLRLRNAGDQSATVTVTMPDSDAVTAEGVEFDFLQADDQTGVCTIQRETNGTINGGTSVALAGPRATAVLVIDANAGAAPNARLEGETDEARTIEGATTFADQAVFTSGVDINGASTLDHTLTLGGSAAIIGGDKVASALELKDISETAFDAGNKSGAVTFDYLDGPWQFCTVTANISSVAITNWPASGKSGTLKLEFVQDASGGRTIAWGAAYRFPGGTDFTLSAAANAIDEFVVSTRDGGTTMRVYEAGKAFAA